MKERNKFLVDHFKIFSLYLKMDYEDCYERMQSHFQKLPEEFGKRKNIEIKVEAWWNERRMPQQEQLAQINTFFNEVAQELGLEWKNTWLLSTVSYLENHVADLQDAIKKFKQPYAIARFYSDCYKNKDLVKRMVSKYCHKCFFIYRIHTNGRLVRDVLRFKGHDEENIFCTVYQYTTHLASDARDWNWKNIKRFNGNLFFNHSILDITFASPEYDEEHGPEYGQIIFPWMLSSEERLGILTGLTDDNYIPAAVTILIRRTDIPYPMDTNEINNYVKEITEKDVSDCAEIMEKINKKIVIDK